MLIGELARRSGVPAKTLRFYEQEGVLDEPARTESGYRDYPAEALDRLAFIRSAQAAGLTLSEIREVIEIRRGGDAPCGHVLELVRDKRAAVERQLEDLRRLSAELAELEERARDFDPGACSPGSICELLQPAATGRARLG